MLRRLTPLVALAALAALIAPASAPAQEPVPRVLERSPYYLSLHGAEPPARGTVLLMHGGGWSGDLGAAADALMSESIDSLQEWGYDVANLGYRSGAHSLRDAQAAFRLLRERLGPDEPICIYGTSAGAQLGLIVAARLGPTVDCVVDLMGPPDLEDFGNKEESALGERLATQAFGAERLAALSPINNVDEIRSPVLVGGAPCDVYIELDDQRELVRRLNEAGGDAELVVIESGDDVDLEHCEVDAESFAEFQAAARSLLASVARPAEREGPAQAPAPQGGSGISPLLLALAAALVGVGALLLVRALRR